MTHTIHTRVSLGIIWIYLYKIEDCFLNTSETIMAKGNRKRRQRGFKSGHNVYLKSYNGAKSEPIPTNTTEYIRPSVYQEHLFTDSLIEPEALAMDSASENPTTTVKLLRTTKYQPSMTLGDQKATPKCR